MKDSLTLALDWTPNTNHTGFFVAQKLNMYQNVGLEVHITTPADDNYAVTPAKKLEKGDADFALCPMESVISYRTKKSPFMVKAIATLLQEDLSAIVSLQDGSIKRPKDMDGMRYASYQARYEDEIVRQMIRNDGGSGSLIISYPEKLGIWNTLLNNDADATWIFTNWEGIEAESKGVFLNTFRLADYRIPYGYSPVIMASEVAIQEHEESYRRFLSATKKGFLYAVQQPEDSAELLKEFVPEADVQNIDLLKSQVFTGAYYGNETSWGHMELERVRTYLHWIQEHRLEQSPLNPQDLMTNHLLPT